MHRRAVHDQEPPSSPSSPGAETKSTSHEPTAAPLVGALGNYELLDRISTGGMAEVFRARSRGVQGFERIVAVKRILRQYAGDRLFVAMFLDEARLAAKLHHPNIIRTLDLGVSDGQYFIVMDYVDGVDLGTLFQRCIDTGMQVPRRHACRIVSEICAGLSYAHKKSEGNQPMNLVHRDVSLPNVLLGTNGEVQLIDFGVAKARQRRAWTCDGMIKGKPAYLAPEQVGQGRADHRSDIYAAGTVLWELLANERLWRGGAWEIIDRLSRKEEVPPPSSKKASVPPELDHIVTRAMAPSPEDRYQDASEMQDALDEYAARAGQRSSPRALSTWAARVMKTDPATMCPPTRVTRPLSPQRADASDSGARRAANRHVLRRITMPTQRRSIATGSRPTMAPKVRIHVTSTPPGAELFVITRGARKKLGKTPIAVELPGYTAHSISLHKPGHAMWTSKLVLTKAGSVRIAAKLTPTADSKKSP